MADLIGVIDYGVGNITSLVQSLELMKGRAQAVRRIDDPSILNDCNKIVLPGVGAFSVAMGNLARLGLDKAILEFAASGRWVLGICLGMHLLFDSSEEFGECGGLSLIPGRVVHFLDSIGDVEARGLKIPHIGWNQNFMVKQHPVLDGLESGLYLYFVHSYRVVCDSEFVLASCMHGLSFPSIVGRDRILGMQPHPEKSQAGGLKILQNFLRL